jgi:hypothetical protein
MAAPVWSVALPRKPPKVDWASSPCKTQRRRKAKRVSADKRTQKFMVSSDPRTDLRRAPIKKSRNGDKEYLIDDSIFGLAILREKINGKLFDQVASVMPAVDYVHFERAGMLAQSSYS